MYVRHSTASRWLGALAALGLLGAIGLVAQGGVRAAELRHAAEATRVAQFWCCQALRGAPRAQCLLAWRELAPRPAER